MAIPEASLELVLPELQQPGDPAVVQPVKALQFMLIVLSGAYSPTERALRPSDGVSGRFGEQTTELVKQFQRGEDLYVDGVVGHDTWKRLLELWFARFDG
jgi:peptidoglycan hydrolase-like protein with peptidoglycan-binding domain